MNLSDDWEEQDQHLNDFHSLNYSNQKEHLWASFDNEVKMDNVIYQLQHINIKKGKGFHDIDAKFYLNYWEQLAYPVYQLFNGIMNTGTIPNDWKENLIMPIPKSGAKNEIENYYRGICIQSVLVKMFDKLLARLIQKHLGPIINENQHGFRRNRDTTSNLLELDTHVAMNCLQIQTQTDIIYIDLAKAFDRDDHSILARKLCTLSCQNDNEFCDRA